MIIFDIPLYLIYLYFRICKWYLMQWHTVNFFNLFDLTNIGLTNIATTVIIEGLAVSMCWPFQIIFSYMMGRHLSFLSQNYSSKSETSLFTGLQLWDSEMLLIKVLLLIMDGSCWRNEKRKEKRRGLFKVIFSLHITAKPVDLANLTQDQNPLTLLKSSMTGFLDKIYCWFISPLVRKFNSAMLGPFILCIVQHHLPHVQEPYFFGFKDRWHEQRGESCAQLQPEEFLQDQRWPWSQVRMDR